MRKRKLLLKFFIAVCFLCAGMLAHADGVSAARLQNDDQVIRKALNKVPNAQVTEIDLDYESGGLVYDVDLIKGVRKYELSYRASDGKLIAYAWEKLNVSPQRNNPMISEDKCRELAEKKVKQASISSIVQKRDDGIDIYKIQMKDRKKQYVLEYNARTAALIEYKWKLLSVSPDTESDYIGVEKARQIALAKVPGAVVVKAEFDYDDSVPVYEIELVKGMYEYEFEIHAKTGEILEQERDRKD